MRAIVISLFVTLYIAAPNLFAQFTMGGLGTSMGMMGGLQGMGSQAMGIGMGAVNGLQGTMGQTGGMMGGMTPGMGGMGGMNQMGGMGGMGMGGMNQMGGMGGMGKGKGAPEFWVCRVKPGRILFEVDGVTESIAKVALYKASAKLPIKTKFIKR